MPGFEVISDGWVAGRYRRAGETVELTEVAAKYEANIRPITGGQTPARRRRKRADLGEEAAQ